MEAGRQAGKQAGTRRQAGRHVQVGRQARTGWQAGMHRLAGKQSSWNACGLTGGQVSGRSGRRMGEQVDCPVNNIVML